MRSLPAFAFIVCSATAFAAPHELTLSSTRIDQLGALAVDGALVINDFPDGNGVAHVIHFKRIDVYAPGARVFAVGADGEHEIPRSARIELIGSDDSGQTRVHLAFDPGFRNVVGSGFSASGTFSISAPAIGARSDGSGTHLVVRPSEEALPAGVTPQVIGDDDGIPSPLASPPPLLTFGIDATTATPRGAVVAIDVDHELLVNRFGGVAAANQTAATNWIADLFATMNVMYVRDLNVTLQQGTTRMRTDATPYVITANGNASQVDLTNFGNYWQANEASTPRTFAALLSGRESDTSHPGQRASGIAYLNVYCRTAGNGGSYSVNKVFTSSSVGVDLSARIVGHELGHNFGAAHTHCTSASTGNYPASSGTIDTCFNQESACYSGAQSCPASGPGAPAGTLMSYCNSIGCGSNHQNVLQFHPVQVTALSALIAQNTTSGCLASLADLIFKNGFD